MSKKNKKKLTDQEIANWVGDYFADVILPICHIAGYKLETTISKDGDKSNTFSVEVYFPYRKIVLYVRKGGIEMVKKKEFSEIRTILLHEAFHILHWKYKEYAEARYIDKETLKELEEDMADRFSIIVDELYQSKKK